MLFSRAWPFLDRVFRPSATALELPNQLVPLVVPTFEPLRHLFTAGGRLRIYGDATSVGAGTTVVQLTAPSGEMTQVPVLLQVLNPDAAARTVRIEMVAHATVPAGPTGVWPVTAGGSVIDAGIIAAGQRRRFSVPIVPTGAQLQIRYLGMTGGVATDAIYFFLELPSEAVDLRTAVHVSAANHRDA